MLTCKEVVLLQIVWKQAFLLFSHLIIPDIISIVYIQNEILYVYD